MLFNTAKINKKQKYNFCYVPSGIKNAAQPRCRFA